MQITVERIFRNDTNKDGVKLVSAKYGKPYWKVDVYATGIEGKLSGFANSMSDPIYKMEEGGTYSVTVEERKVGDNVYKNFKMLSDEEKELEELRAFKAEQMKGAGVGSNLMAAKTFEPSSESEAITSEDEESDSSRF